MKKNMRILHILCSNRYSGAENVVCQIIHMFANEDDFEFIYCSPDGDIRSVLEEKNIHFEPIKEVSVSEIRKVIKVTSPDIIHAHDMRASFYASLACGKIPLITHIHNNNFDSRKITLKAILYRFAAKKSKHIFWVSESSFEGYYYHDKFKKKSTVLYNVIDSQQLIEKAEMADDKGKYDIVYLGRLTYQKNPERIIEVLDNVIEKCPYLKVAIIGTGELENDIKELINQKGLETNIHMLGFMRNPYGILKNSKIMIMTSRWEGTPMCGLEAMALGIPVISTPTDGLKELVLDNITGYLSDDNEQLAEDIIKVINNEELRIRMSEETVKRAHKLMDIAKYKEIIEEKYRMEMYDEKLSCD